MGLLEGKNTSLGQYWVLSLGEVHYTSDSLPAHLFQARRQKLSHLLAKFSRYEGFAV